MRITIRAPDHLGDGVLALPGVQALSRMGSIDLRGPRWVPELYAGLDSAAGDNPDLVVLFKPSFRAAWAARGAPLRVGLLTQARWPLLSTAVVPARGHRLLDLNRVAIAAGAELSPEALPTFTPTTKLSGEGTSGESAGRVLLLPGTASGPPVAWQGFRALADALADRGVPVAFTGGPDEAAQITELAGPHPVFPPAPIATFAALAARVRAVVGNDSGLTHLAAAARRGADLDVRAVHVIYGSTNPARTGAPGSTAHQAPAPACWPCYRKRCPLGLGCQGVTVGSVLDALTR